MSVPASTGFVVSLLERLRIDPVLIGDIVEQYAQNRSRVWLWRQVTGALALALIGYVREPRPFVQKNVRLTAMPAGSPVGGLGFLALAILLSVVAPNIWWVIAAAGVGGVVLGAALIVIRRGRARRSPGRTIFVLVVLGIMTVSAGARGEHKRGPAVRLDPVDGIIEAFRSHQVVMLPGGHGSKSFHDLLLQIMRDPRAPGLITDVVVEFGSSRYQDLIERYMRGDSIPDSELRKAWQNTTLPGVTNDGPYVEQFYREMRALNLSLPPGRRIRVVGGDPPIDWNHVTEKSDLRKWTVLRSTYPADLLRREVVARGRRALVVYGQLKFPRKEMQTNYDMSDWQAQTITSWLEYGSGAKAFVIWAEGGDELVKLQPEIASWPHLALTRIRGTPLGAADFTLFNGERDRFAIRGIDDFVKIPRGQHRPMPAEELVDAIIWNGNAPPSPMLLSAATCADPDYLPMRTGRILLAGTPPAEIDAIKKACATHQK